MSAAASTDTPAELAPLRHLGGARRALAILAHPDDESWAFGALLLRLAAAGVETHLLCLTRGEGGGDPKIRLGELHRAARHLGLTLHAPRTWGRDGALEAEHAASESAIAMQTLQPELLLIFDEEGAYGHRDHIACSLGALRAATSTMDRAETVLRTAADPAPGNAGTNGDHAQPTAGDAEGACTPPRVLSPLYPRDHFRPLQRALRRRAPNLLDPSLRSQALGRELRSAHFRVTPSASEAARKRDALRAHSSQHRHGPAGPVFLSAPVFEPLLEDEWYLLRDATDALASFT